MAQTNNAKTKRKIIRPRKQEVYITRVTPNFFATERKEFDKFYDCINKTEAIAYGYWGATWRNYLYETDPVKYYIMISENRLYLRIMEVQIDAQSVYDKAFKELISKGISPEKAEDNAKSSALNEIVYNEKYLK